MFKRWKALMAIFLIMTQVFSMTSIYANNVLRPVGGLIFRSLLIPSDISKPDLAGYNFVHPQSLIRMTMTMMIENEMDDAKLTMSIPDVGLLFSAVTTIKLNGNKLSSSHYNWGNNCINIDLGNLSGDTAYPGIYYLEVYVKIKPSSHLNIVHYNQRVNAKEKLVVSNELKALIGGGELAPEETIFELEPYNLKLIKIPKIN